MTRIKHLLNNVLEMKSNKNNLKQGDVFLNNKKRFMGFNKIEGFTCAKPAETQGSEVATKYNLSNASYVSLEHTNFEVTGITCKSGYEGTAIATVCDGPEQPFNLRGCDNVSIGLEIKQKSNLQRQKDASANELIGNKYNDASGNLKNHYNVRDKKGNIYYVNLDGQYYKYQNAAGESTFNPSHVDFSNTCPKTAPKFIKNTPYIVEGDIDPTSLSGNNECIKFNDLSLNTLYSETMKLEKEIKDLTEQNRRGSGETTGAVFKRNKAAILLSHKINEYNKLVEQSKKITNDIKSFDTSREDFLKSITALQIQYGVVGLTSIALVYLTIKMMSNNES